MCVRYARLLTHNSGDSDQGVIALSRAIASRAIASCSDITEAAHLKSHRPSVGREAASSAKAAVSTSASSTPVQSLSDGRSGTNAEEDRGDNRHDNNNNNNNGGNSNRQANDATTQRRNEATNKQRQINKMHCRRRRRRRRSFVRSFVVRSFVRRSLFVCRACRFLAGGAARRRRGTLRTKPFQVTVHYLPTIQLSHYPHFHTHMISI